MSAPLSMCRTLIFVLALAAWAGIAHGATQTKVKPQRTATAARTTAASKASRPAASSKTTARRTAAARSSAKSRTSAKPRTSVKTASQTRVKTSTAARAASVKTRTAKTVPARRTAATSVKNAVKPDSAPQRAVAASKPVPASAASATIKPAVVKVSARSRSRRAALRRASLRIPMAPPLRGSAEILAHQNTQLEAEGLERIVDDADLDNRIEQRLLVPLPASSVLAVNPGLPENRRYCRSWTAQFLEDLARAHSAAFHKPIMVSSAVRTIEYQKRLMRTNRNAAAAEGDIVSPHVMGATIDIAKSGLTRQEISWLRTQLAAQVAAGNIDVEEEFRQACFHITVYRSYANPPDLPAPAQPADSAALTDTSAGL